MRVEYSSNNSGGSWWLKDKDWVALEKAGWTVIWGGLHFCKSRYGFDNRKPNYKFKECASAEKCKGHRLSKSHKNMKPDDRWLGALARGAYKNFGSVKEALLEFEKLTGQSVMDDGCNCCGSPHSFSWEGDYCSGERCGEFLFGSEAKLSKRELLEKSTR